MNIILALRKFVLLGFLLCGFLTLTAALFASKLHWISQAYIFNITYIGYACIPILLWLYKRNLFSKIPMNWGLWLILFFSYSILLVISGLMVRNPVNTWLVDSVTFTAFSGFIFLGTSDEFWEDFQKYGFYFFIAAVLINLQATTMVNVNYWQSEENLLKFRGSERITRSIVGYKTQFAQSFWPLYFLTVNPKNKVRMFFLLFAVLFLIFQQIVFQKRGPTIRIIFYIICFIYLAAKNTRYKISTTSYRRTIFIFFILLLVFFFGFKKYLPSDLITRQYSALISRFEGKTGNAHIKYTNGALGIFTSENERVREIGIMFNSMNNLDIIIGKFFGGKYLDTEILKAERDSTHIGIFNFFLKGGVIYLGLFLMMVLGLLTKISKYKKERITMVCFLIFSVMTIFLFAEGWFYYGSLVYDLMLYGVVIGRLIIVK